MATFHTTIIPTYLNSIDAYSLILMHVAMVVCNVAMLCVVNQTDWICVYYACV